ncbi:cobalt ECF transporter T component CbiQ [Spirulina sp. 06S082]|uniref:cobalt ECF transporter T component CbiQ n=1 Tax=Spirulina sp. 06S082 TaxID=3110248 RepID=UPI002B1FBCEC|nr:cobalt ECF transporter T component CbiQ [Spirulina sp. 06S082]MEA5471264.1 cobalt ECF transporter T component CbiQ [Spirulina sp. 06S082]
MNLDRYARLKSPIHRWEPRSKLVSLLTLIFAFAFVRHLILLPFMVVITAGLYLISRLPFGFWLSRLRYPGFFIAAMVFFLPFGTGETVLWQWGWLSLKQEGCEALALILVRFASILTVSLVLFGTAPIANSLKAMRSLGLPALIVDMALLTYRYLQELQEMRVKMQRAMQLRGFQRDRLTRRNLQILAQLTGTLLIRSYERSQRVYYAMILRGYGQEKAQAKKSIQDIDRFSWILSIITLTVAMTIFILELLMSR